MIKEEALIKRYPGIEKQLETLSASDKIMMFQAMDIFQRATQETIAGGEELLKMCDGCAFKKGSDANNYPHTVLTAVQCVIMEEPFFCHKRFCPNGKEKLCNGWINVVNNKWNEH